LRSTDLGIEGTGLQERGAEVRERERLAWVLPHGDTRSRDNAVGPGSRIEIGDEMKNQQALRELLRRLRGGIRRGDESSSTLQTPDKGAERGEMIAPRTNLQAILSHVLE